MTDLPPRGEPGSVSGGPSETPELEELAAEDVSLGTVRLHTDAGHVELYLTLECRSSAPVEGFASEMRAILERAGVVVDDDRRAPVDERLSELERAPRDVDGELLYRGRHPVHGTPPPIHWRVVIPEGAPGESESEAEAEAEAEAESEAESESESESESEAESESESESEAEAEAESESEAETESEAEAESGSEVGYGVEAGEAHGIDVYDVTRWIKVDQGDPLFVVGDPTESIPGIDIHGGEIEARPVEECPIELGNDCRWAEDGRTCVAAIDGTVRFRDGTLSVERLLELEELGFDTGNVDFNGTVHIKGSVPDRFQIKATADVVIGRVVEGANIEAGGTIQVGQGIQGDGRADIRAGQDVNANYINDANVLAEGDVVVNREIMNSHVRAGGRVLVPKGSVIGGAVYASRGVEAGILGSVMEVATSVIVGFAPEAVPRLEELLQREESIADEIEELERKGGDALDAPPISGPAGLWIRGLQRQRKRLEKRRSALHAEQRELTPPAEEPETPPSITVTRQCFPKVTVQVGAVCRRRFSETVKGKQSLTADPEQETVITRSGR